MKGGTIKWQKKELGNAEIVKNIIQKIMCVIIWVEYHINFLQYVENAKQKGKK